MIENIQFDYIKILEFTHSLQLNALIMINF